MSCTVQQEIIGTKLPLLGSSQTNREQKLRKSCFLARHSVQKNKTPSLNLEKRPVGHYMKAWLELNHIQVTEAAHSIGVSRSTMSAAINQNSVTKTLLKKWAQYVGEPLHVWYLRYALHQAWLLMQEEEGGINHSDVGT